MHGLKIEKREIEYVSSSPNDPTNDPLKIYSNIKSNKICK